MCFGILEKSFLLCSISHLLSVLFLMRLLMPFISGLLCSPVSLRFYDPFIHLLLFKANISQVLCIIFIGCILMVQEYLLGIKVFNSLDGLGGGLKKLMTQGGGAERWPARSEDKCDIVAHPDYGTDIFNSQ